MPIIGKFLPRPIVYLTVLLQHFRFHKVIKWGWGIMGQKITGQSIPDWLKMTSPRPSKPNSGE